MRPQSMKTNGKEPNRRGDAGFSLLELAIVVFIILAVASFAIPSLRNTMAVYRGSAAAQGIASQLSLAKMRAASGFTRSRINLNTPANTYRREIYDKTTSSYVDDSGQQFLGNTVAFGFGSIAVPAGGQSTIQQSSHVIFNSRGIPIDDSGTPVGTYAIYVNNEGRYYAVTVNSAGQIKTWRYSGSSWQAL
jgi:prepilin-type N-terminal cleavage/methylation domain-containing protein